MPPSIAMRLDNHINVGPGAPGAIALPSRGLPAVRDDHAPTSLVRLLFYAFVFLIPFETIVPWPLEPPTVVGALLLLTMLLHPGLFLRWPPKAFWCFFVYLYLYAVLGALEHAKYRAEMTYDLIVFAQVLVLGWIAYSVMRDERAAEVALRLLVIACVLLSILQVAGVASEDTDVGAKVGRVTAFGFHPNNLARILVLGMLTLIGLTYGRAGSVLRPRYLAWPAVALIGVALVQTGSRGGLLALGAGLMVFVLRGGTAWSKLRNALGVLLVIGFFIWVGSQSEVTRLRFERTLEEGDMARREEIYPNAWRMFQEKPLIGWGMVTGNYELGTRLGHPEEESKNPHNLLLYALVSTGMVGALPMVAGLALMVLAAWRARPGPHGVLPLVLVVAVLVANMSSVWMFNKLFWLITAYVLAVGERAARRGRQ